MSVLISSNHDVGFTDFLLESLERERLSVGKQIYITLFVPIKLFAESLNHLAVFFSHNKSMNNTLNHNFSAIYSA
jgi:hypothetical protein